MTARWSDARLATAIGLGLFVMLGWPLFVVRALPFEDLGGHLATITILRNPGEYPEFVSTGLLKTNAAIYAFGLATRAVLDEERAIRAFSILTLLANALVLPHFVLRFRSRAAMGCAAPFMAPFVHHWFFSMGMMNFALALPLTLVLMMLLRDQESAPTGRRGVGIVLLTLGIWFCHSFPLLVVLLLVATRVLTAKGMEARIARLRALVPPVVPVALLVVSTVASHALVRFTPMGATHETSFSSAPWMVYDVWAHFLYGMTEATVTSLFLGVILVVVALRGGRMDVGLLSWPGWLLVTCLYWLTPSVAFDWAFFSARFLPFFWFAALVRVPERMPRWLVAGAFALAGMYVVGLDSDVIRAARDHEELISGTGAVPRGAKLLPLMFRTRKTSKNTWSLDSGSGYYVFEKHTSAWDVWATNRSMPIVRTSMPHARFDRVFFRRFLMNDTVAAWCADEAHRGIPATPEACAARHGEAWRAMWIDARAEYTHILLFAPPPDIEATIPTFFREKFRNGDLRILERVDE